MNIDTLYTLLMTLSKLRYIMSLSQREQFSLGVFHKNLLTNRKVTGLNVILLTLDLFRSLLLEFSVYLTVCVLKHNQP